MYTLDTDTVLDTANVLDTDTVFDTANVLDTDTVLDTANILDTANVRLDTEHPPSYGSSTVNVLTSTTKQTAFTALHRYISWRRCILCTQTYYRSLPWVAHWCDQVQMILMSVLGYGFPAIVWQPGGGLWLISDYPATLYRRSIPSWSTCPSI